MLATLQRLGVAQSRSRPAVSNDKPYSESLFKTLKYRPQFPLQPFTDLLQARRWVTALGHRAGALVQPGPSTQRHRLRDPGARSLKDR